MHVHHIVPQIDVETFGCRLTTEAMRNLPHWSSDVNRSNKALFLLNTTVLIQNCLLSAV